MITEIVLKFGRAPMQPAERILGAPITVFVGPNNSGKSRILHEISHYCTNGMDFQDNHLVANIEFSSLTEEQAAEEIAMVQRTDIAGESLSSGQVLLHHRGQKIRQNHEYLLKALQSPNQNKEIFCGSFLRLRTVKLDGPERIRLADVQPAGDLQGRCESSFQFLFRDNTLREEVRRIVHRAFNSYLVVDPTYLGQLRLRLSKCCPNDEIVEKGIHSDAVAFHADAQLLSEFSDGVKAFTGMIIEMIAGDPYILLIDEPEAFLHPAISEMLGQEIAKASARKLSPHRERRVFVSTHSSAFIMGCVQSGTPTNIVRLTYRGGNSEARILSHDNLMKLMRDPLLRSTKALEGLFSEAVLVCEGDSDRAFYQEINYRMLQFNPHAAVQNALFLNAQNKQTEHQIIRPLRDLGIPAAAIVDLDVIKEGGANWSNLLKAAYVPEADISSLGQARGEILKRFKDSNGDMKQMGLSILSDSDRESAENLIRNLARYGIFVVPVGEVEGWLKNMGVPGRKSDWLTSMFERLGSDPASERYVRPSQGDVWQFIESIQNWVMHPDRKGIPK